MFHYFKVECSAALWDVFDWIHKNETEETEYILDVVSSSEFILRKENASEECFIQTSNYKASPKGDFQLARFCFA